MDKNHYIVRVGDGVNFKNSIKPFWGVKRGKNNNIKSIVKKINQGDILWFLTNAKYGGKFIGMAEFSCFYDKEDEPLFPINTYTNEQQGWSGDEKWDIQIHYKKFYNTERQNITAILKGQSPILYYSNYQDNISNLPNHYNNFIFYSEKSNRFNDN